jgi:hypothetical protein
MIRYCHKRVKHLGEENMHVEADRVKDDVWYERVRSYQRSYHPLPPPPGQLFYPHANGIGIKRTPLATRNTSKMKNPSLRKDSGGGINHGNPPPHHHIKRASSISVFIITTPSPSPCNTLVGVDSLLYYLGTTPVFIMIHTAMSTPSMCK